LENSRVAGEVDKGAIVVAAFYKFCDLASFEALREPLRTRCYSQNIKGTILLASEGINGTISGSAEGIDYVLNFLRQQEEIGDFAHKVSYNDSHPFTKLRIRLKKEIVTIRKEIADPTKKVGEYVDPADWNQLISDPDTIVVDTRNSYEVELGTFKNALDPKTESFGEFPEYVDNHLADHKDKKIAMFCTGGIRCEKATSYLLENGFEKVYHLQGGILNYLEKIPDEESTWEGDCFVFDQRVTVNSSLEKGNYELCFACQEIVSEEDRDSVQYEEGVSCPKCFNTISDEQRQRAKERQRQIEIAKARNRSHFGDQK